MNLIEIIIIAVGISMDAFAVSMSSGLNKQMHNKRSAIRLSFHFGLFQCLMPIIGWFIGSKIEKYIVSVDHWIAFSLLLFIGCKMIYECYQNNISNQTDPSKGWNLVTLSFATSIDALAIGLSLAFLRVNIIYPAIFFGVITAIFSLSGIFLGAHLGKILGKKMEFIGGLILIIIGIKILLTDLLS
jgi:manganese efflux pump family protein